MRNLVIAAGLIAFGTLAGCSTSAEDSMGKSLEKAGSVSRSARQSLLPGQSVEDSAGKAIGNAGEAVETTVQPSGGAIWDQPEGEGNSAKKKAK